MLARIECHATYQHPFTLQLHITDRCNLRCAHCYQDSSLTPEMTIEELLRTVDGFQSFCTSLQFRAQLTLTGGEPFVRKDFLEFLQEVRQRDSELRIAILSNGTVITKEIAQKLGSVPCLFKLVSTALS